MNSIFVSSEWEKIETDRSVWESRKASEWIDRKSIFESPKLICLIWYINALLQAILCSSSESLIFYNPLIAWPVFFFDIYVIWESIYLLILVQWKRERHGPNNVLQQKDKFQQRDLILGITADGNQETNPPTECSVLLFFFCAWI